MLKDPKIPEATHAKLSNNPDAPALTMRMNLLLKNNDTNIKNKLRDKCEYLEIEEYVNQHLQTKIKNLK